MQPQTLGDLFGQPGFLALLLCILLVIGNIMVGVTMLPRDKRKRLYRVHRAVYLLVMFTFVFFMVMSFYNENLDFLAIFAFTYFLLVVPLTRRVDETLHAILASVGLVLLVVVAAFNI